MIIPALLTTNERIATERINLSRQMSGWLHIDVLDNTLYKFEGLSVEQLESLDFGELLLEFHCMTDSVTPIATSSLPIERIILHVEAPKWQEEYEQLSSKGVDTWLAVDPSTSLSDLDLPTDVPGIVVMGVIPGQSGQSLLEDTYRRIDILKEYYPDSATTVDGGANGENVRELIAHGVDNIVMGSAIFSGKDPIEAYHRYASFSDPIYGAFEAGAGKDEAKEEE